MHLLWLNAGHKLKITHHRSVREKIKYWRSVLLRNLFLMYLKLHEHVWEGRMKYLFFKRGSKVLVVVFSGMDSSDDKRFYNYVRGLSSVKADFLYLSDPFGYRGSYYWKENGSEEPSCMTQRLVGQVINGGGYKCVATMGSSKGGSAAIMHGIKLGVDVVMAAGNQYNVGSYVSELPGVFEGMTGCEVSVEAVARLNAEFRRCLDDYKPHTRLCLMYSTEEPTYAEHTAEMLRDLQERGIPYEAAEHDFKLHGDVGTYFKPYARRMVAELVRKYD